MTKYLLRGPLGYVAGAQLQDDWTQDAEKAHWYNTSAAAHEARRRWLAVHQEHLTVVVRDGHSLVPFQDLIYGAS